MKKYLTIFVPVVVLALVFAAGLFIVPAVESPQAKLDRQIDEQVELAQRMLYQFNAATPKLRDVFEAAGLISIERVRPIAKGDEEIEIRIRVDVNPGELTHGAHGDGETGAAGDVREPRGVVPVQLEQRQRRAGRVLAGREPDKQIGIAVGVHVGPGCGPRGAPVGNPRR